MKNQTGELLKNDYSAQVLPAATSMVQRWKHHGRKTATAIGVAATLMFSSGNAMAWGGCCDLSSVYNWIQSAQDRIISDLSSAIETSTNIITNRVEMAENAIVAAIEKHRAAEKEMTQAQLNYEAAAIAQQAGVKAHEAFVSDSAKPYKVCETMGTSASLGAAAVETNINSKARTAAGVRRNMGTESASAAAKEVLDAYRQKYCTAEDAQRGLCTEAPLQMQAANLNAGTLLNPNASQTYSEDEKVAAQDYIRMVTNPVPIERLPRALEKTPQGERFRTEQMHATSVLSVAEHSLNQILESKSPNQQYEGASGGTAAISMVGLMQKFVEERFVDPKYKESLATWNELGLLRELTLQSAAKNWMDYQAYLQNERIENILATQLAINAKDRAERQMAIARAQASVTK